MVDDDDDGGDDDYDNGMNGDLWDRVRGLGRETWKGCE